ncbi:retrotransposon protein, putative, ty1-copia subclass, partial [Tanacetum coccineum]
MSTENDVNPPTPNPAHNSNFSLLSVLGRERLTGPNYMDWIRNLRFTLRYENKEYVLDEHIPTIDDETQEEIKAHQKHYDDANKVSCIMASFMSPELQKTFENTWVYELNQQLKEMFQAKASKERLDVVKSLIACKPKPGASICTFVLEMKGYFDILESLNMVFDAELSIDIILSGKAAKRKFDHGSKRKAEYEIAPTSGPNESVCFYCNTKRHWKRSCLKYVKDLKDRKGLKESRRLKHGELNLVIDNRKITHVTRIGKYELMLKSGSIDEEPIVNTNTQQEVVTPVKPDDISLPIRRTSGRVSKPPQFYYGFHIEEDKISDSTLSELDEPANYKEAMASPKAAKWKEAMKSEIQSMYDNQVWNLVDTTPGLKTVGCKWIFKKKTDMDGKVHTYKARLVAKGYTQTHGIDYEETFSPVAKIKSIRIMLAIAAFHDYEIWQMDVKTAFLNGKLTEDVFMAQPEGFENAKYPKRVCKLQKAIYGLKQASRSWNLCFHEKVTQFGFSRSEDESCIYVKVSGSVVVFLAMTCTRPDVSFALSMVSRYQQNPGEGHWTTVKNILKYLRNTKDKFLVYGGEEELRVTGAVTWKSSKQNTVADSTCESEYIATCEASKEAIWMKNFIGDLGVVLTVQNPIEIFCNNESVVSLTKEPKDHRRSKHIERKYHFVRSKVKDGHVIVKHIQPKDYPADPFSKALDKETYGNADYDYDPYDDDMYEGQKIPDNIQSICDNLDFKAEMWDSLSSIVLRVCLFWSING